MGDTSLEGNCVIRILKINILDWVVRRGCFLGAKTPLMRSRPFALKRRGMPVCAKNELFREKRVKRPVYLLNIHLFQNNYGLVLDGPRCPVKFAAAISAKRSSSSESGVCGPTQYEIKNRSC